jgi:hypothetical protein
VCLYAELGLYTLNIFFSCPGKVSSELHEKKGKRDAHRKKVSVFLLFTRVFFSFFFFSSSSYDDA